MDKTEVRRKYAADLLKRIESGELVEVVRCKDCKHFEEYDPIGICGLHSIIPMRNRNGVFVHMTKEDFCSCGERKEE